LALNPSDRERGQALLFVLEGTAAMKTEAPLHRYRHEAAECELRAEKATNQADRRAWQSLAEDWKKLAQGAERKVSGALQSVDGNKSC